MKNKDPKPWISNAKLNKIVSQKLLVADFKGIEDIIKGNRNETIDLTRIEVSVDKFIYPISKQRKWTLVADNIESDIPKYEKVIDGFKNTPFFPSENKIRKTRSQINLLKNYVKYLKQLTTQETETTTDQIVTEKIIHDIALKAQSKLRKEYLKNK